MIPKIVVFGKNARVFVWYNLPIFNKIYAYLNPKTEQ